MEMMSDRGSDVPEGFVEIDMDQMLEELHGLRAGYCRIVRLALNDLDAGRPAEAAAFLRAFLERHIGAPAEATVQ